MDHAEASVLINRMLEGTQCSASTTEGGSYGRILSCEAKVTWWPSSRQVLRQPQVMLKVERTTWDDVYDEVRAWRDEKFGPCTEPRPKRSPKSPVERLFAKRDGT